MSTVHHGNGIGVLLWCYFCHEVQVLDLDSRKNDW